jgi:hypothetical protein
MCRWSGTRLILCFFYFICHSFILLIIKCNQIMWYFVYTFVSVIICYDSYHNDFDMFFVLWWKCSWMIYANFNIVVYLWLLDANIDTPLMFAPVVEGSFLNNIYIHVYISRHGIAEILQNLALNTNLSNQINQF